MVTFVNINRRVKCCRSKYPSQRENFKPFTTDIYKILQMFWLLKEGFWMYLFTSMDMYVYAYVSSVISKTNSCVRIHCIFCQFEGARITFCSINLEGWHEWLAVKQLLPFYWITKKILIVLILTENVYYWQLNCLCFKSYTRIRKKHTSKIRINFCANLTQTNLTNHIYLNLS